MPAVKTSFYSQFIKLYQRKWDLLRLLIRNNFFNVREIWKRFNKICSNQTRVEIFVCFAWKGSHCQYQQELCLFSGIRRRCWHTMINWKLDKKKSSIRYIHAFFRIKSSNSLRKINTFVQTKTLKKPEWCSMMGIVLKILKKRKNSRYF